MITTTPWQQLNLLPKKPTSSQPPYDPLDQYRKLHKKTMQKYAGSTLRFTMPTKAVLRLLAEQPEGVGIYGYHLMGRLTLGPSTVYPMLHRLEHFGWIEGWWVFATEDNQKLGKPRRYYELTSYGRARCQEKGII